MGIPIPEKSISYGIGAIVYFSHIPLATNIGIYDHVSLDCVVPLKQYVIAVTSVIANAEPQKQGKTISDGHNTSNDR